MSSLLQTILKIAAAFLSSAADDSSSKGKQKKSSSAGTGSKSTSGTKSTSKSTAKTSYAMSLQQLCQEYEQQLCDRTWLYALSSGKSRQTIRAVFTRPGFCHLFSIASMADAKDEDSSNSDYAGIRGWKNCIGGEITYEDLQKIDPENFDYYYPEHEHFDWFIQTVKSPKAVIFDASRAGQTSLKADIILYRTFTDTKDGEKKTVHICLSKDDDGSFFVRSYFLRNNNRDKADPSKYIEGMQQLNVESVKVQKD